MADAAVSSKEKTTAHLEPLIPESNHVPGSKQSRGILFWLKSHKRYRRVGLNVLFAAVIAYDVATDVMLYRQLRTAEFPTRIGQQCVDAYFAFMIIGGVAKGFNFLNKCLQAAGCFDSVPDYGKDCNFVMDLLIFWASSLPVRCIMLVVMLYGGHCGYLVSLFYSLAAKLNFLNAMICYSYQIVSLALQFVSAPDPNNVIGSTKPLTSTELSMVAVIIIGSVFFPFLHLCFVPWLCCQACGSREFRKPSLQLATILIISIAWSVPLYISAINLYLVFHPGTLAEWSGCDRLDIITSVSSSFLIYNDSSCQKDQQHIDTTLTKNYTIQGATIIESNVITLATNCTEIVPQELLDELLPTTISNCRVLTTLSYDEWTYLPQFNYALEYRVSSGVRLCSKIDFQAPVNVRWTSRMLSYATASTCCAQKVISQPPILEGVPCFNCNDVKNCSIDWTTDSANNLIFPMHMTLFINELFLNVSYSEDLRTPCDAFGHSTARTHICVSVIV